MVETTYSILVEQAKQKRDTQNIELSRMSVAMENFQDSSNELESLARDLKAINDHIEVDSEIFDEASSDYEEISRRLVEKLHLPNEAIRIIPQGSSSTKTLIRSPDNSKFDIDAVCIVDLSMVEVDYPMTFFEKIGEALKDWDPDPKKRCWKINFLSRRYYIEFTPSTPLDKVPLTTEEKIIFCPSQRYREKALAVVDTPTQQWKTSNPEGFSTWVSDQASRPILKSFLKKSMRYIYSEENITPVPEQEVELSDTLRVAIRLLKRHRYMSIRRNYIEPHLKPISIIIVTLLTQCYEGLADKGAVYTHPIKLLIDIVELMPYMVELRGNDYWIANPTVEGENFAEKWNDNPKLKESFDTWTDLLMGDLTEIMLTINESDRRQKIIEIFGCTTAQSSTPPKSSGLAPRKPTQPHKAPPTKGLA